MSDLLTWVTSRQSSSSAESRRTKRALPGSSGSGHTNSHDAPPGSTDDLPAGTSAEQPASHYAAPREEEPNGPRRPPSEGTQPPHPSRPEKATSARRHPHHQPRPQLENRGAPRLAITKGKNSYLPLRQSRGERPPPPLALVRGEAPPGGWINGLHLGPSHLRPRRKNAGLGSTRPSPEGSNCDLRCPATRERRT